MKFREKIINTVMLMIILNVPAESSADNLEVIYTYTGIENAACYEENGNVQYMVSSGAKLTVVGQTEDRYIIRSRNGNTAYIKKENMEKGELYAEADQAVDLRGYIPEAEYCLDFATGNNITGKALYPAIPLLEKTTAQKLLDAYEIFENDGYIIKIYDAYRPASAQYELWEKVRDSRFIADPDSGGSWHSTGRAVDMTLEDAETGKELEMPTAMHVFDEAAARYSKGKWTESATENVEYMTEVMRQAGFQTIETEWWHFEYKGPGGYMDRNISFSSIEYGTVKQESE